MHTGRSFAHSMTTSRWASSAAASAPMPKHPVEVTRALFRQMINGSTFAFSIRREVKYLSW